MNGRLAKAGSPFDLPTSLTVGVADFKICADRSAVLSTYALGSCIAVAMFHPGRQVASLLHFMLPDSSIRPATSERKPYMFADTGIRLQLEQMAAHGCDRAAISTRLVGGGNVISGLEAFNIGARNASEAHRILGENGLAASAADVGGDRSRSVRLEVGTGRLFVSSFGEETEL